MKVALILKSPEFSDKVLEQKVIYCDGAYKHKGVIGDKEVLCVVGDFDSLKAPPLCEKTVKLNVEKDYTDGEYALRVAKDMGAKEVVIYGATGGKTEHVLGNLALLKIAKDIGVDACIKDGEDTIRLIEGRVKLKVEKGKALSLIPYGGSCKFIDSSGLYYPLKDITLTPSDTLGISNKPTQEEVEINFLSGQALVIY